jgi:hypothetical protein
MKRIALVQLTAAFVAAVVLAPAAHARDDRMLLDIQPVLNGPLGKDRFDDTVQFYWAEQPFPQPLQTFDIQTSERRAFAPTRTEQQACEVAFIEALAALRDHAKELGGNAVVDIKSIYKNREFRSDSQYECRVGYVVTTVSLEGRVVKLPGAGITTSRPGF